MKKDEKFKLSTPIPVRFAESSLKEINRVAEKMNLSVQELIRFSVSIGLACLEKNGYDIPEQIAERALKK